MNEIWMIRNLGSKMPSIHVIFGTNILLQKCRYQNVFACFIDYKKVIEFYKQNCAFIMFFRQVGADERDFWIIKKSILAAKS